MTSPIRLLHIDFASYYAPHIWNPLPSEIKKEMEIKIKAKANKNKKYTYPVILILTL